MRFTNGRVSIFERPSSRFESKKQREKMDSVIPTYLGLHLKIQVKVVPKSPKKVVGK